MTHKLVIVSIVLIYFLSGCGLNKVVEERSGKNFSFQNIQKYQLKDQFKELPIRILDEQDVFLVDDLCNLLNGKYHFDELHRSLTITIDDQLFKITYGIPVVEQNGIYLPTDEISLLLKDAEVFLPVTFIEKSLGQVVSISEQQLSFQWEKQVIPTSGNGYGDFLDRSWTVDEMVEYLSFLEKPIANAQVSTIPNHLPGANRGYRNGYHEGIDWYGYASGNHISFTTPVMAMADGVIVRVDHDYQEYPSVIIRNKDLALTQQFGETPEYIFDRLRGRQVWVQYEKGVMNRFAHLDSIPETLQVGDTVSSDTIIGFVGNSGTSGAVKGDGSELHLHQDLLIYGELFWKPFSLEEIKEIVVEIFK